MSSSTAPSGFLGRGEAPSHHGLRGHWKRFLIGFTGFIVLMALIGLLNPPAKQHPACHPATTACGVPPSLPSAMIAPVGIQFRSPALGYTLRYDAGWKIESQSATAIVFSDQLTNSLVRIVGAAASSASPGALLASEVSFQRPRVLGLAGASSPADQILGPELAAHPAVAATFRGTIDTPQGPGQPVEVFFLAGGNSSTSLVATLITGELQGMAHHDALQHADALLATLRFMEDQGV